MDGPDEHLILSEVKSKRRSLHILDLNISGANVLVAIQKQDLKNSQKQQRNAECIPSVLKDEKYLKVYVPEGGDIMHTIHI